MIHVYLMPGMSANSLIFEKIKFPSHFSLHYLNWISPKIEESLENYAKRFSALIMHDDPVLIGVSFGGVLVQEISKIIKVKKLIIISSAAILAFNKNRILNEKHQPEKLDDYQKIRFQIENLLIKKLNKTKKLIILRPTDIINFNNPISSIHNIKSKLQQKGMKGIIYRFLLGHRTYNLVHIDDLANAISFFVKKEIIKSYEIYNVTSDDEKNIFHKLSNSYNFSFILPKIFLENIFRLLFFYLRKPNPLRIYDNTKIRKVGFKFSFKLKNIL